ncbi:amino acid ABC transporter permease [Nesterenkonia muleiensis]|uniref:amino acid ABC transporter permease n=1 Tax=Nesterenkonia muleiensis TaxID=2282648 RepID=UPI000E732E15|nr:ABC transporter permease subunit [Nesterenkonia muleiensis]
MQFILDLMPGLATTFGLWLLILLIGLPGGLALGYLLGLGSRTLRVLGLVIVNIARGFPGLVTLYFVYSGLPELGVFLTNFQAVVAAFAFTTMGYTAEIFHSAIHSVPRAQTEAATALGLKAWKIQVKVVLPQAIRSVVPTLLGFTVIVLQATALGYSVGVRELTGLSYNLGSISFQALSYMLAAGLIYLVLCVVISQLADWMQSRSAGKRVKRVKHSPRKSHPTTTPTPVA